MAAQPGRVVRSDQLARRRSSSVPGMMRERPREHMNKRHRTSAENAVGSLCGHTIEGRRDEGREAVRKEEGEKGEKGERESPGRGEND